MTRYEAQNIGAPDGFALAASQPSPRDLGKVDPGRTELCQIELAEIELGRASTETRGSCGIMLDVIFNLIPLGIDVD